MNHIESLIFLLAAAALLAQLARLLKVPYPILLVLGGLVMGFVPGLPDIEIPPEVIFVAFLPPLLNSAAFSSSPLDLRAQLRPIVMLAVGLVLARLGVPERVSTVVGGESLVNDGTGLAAFKVAVAVVLSGAFSVWEAGLSFLLVGGGGLLVGLIFVRIVLPLWARLREPTVVITFSVLIPYAVYILAEEVLHVSGILAVVTYGLYQGWNSPRLFPSASTRLQAVAFWGVLIFLLEVLLFVLLGQQLPSILGDIEEYSVWVVLLYAALVYAVVVLVRFAWFFTTPYFHPVFDRLLHSRYLRAPWQERLVMSWSGMRGAVSLAAALAVPLSTNAGDPFPGRDLIVFLTFSVILATLVLQGLTLGPLIAALRLRGEGEADKLAELRARLEAARVALDRLERLGDDGRVSPESQERMRQYYEGNIQRYTADLEAGGTTEEYADNSGDWRDWRCEALAAEREALLSLRDEGKISPEVMRRIERDLDLQESRLGG